MRRRECEAGRAARNDKVRRALNGHACHVQRKHAMRSEMGITIKKDGWVGGEKMRLRTICAMVGLVKEPKGNPQIPKHASRVPVPPIRTRSHVLAHWIWKLTVD
jgi:hypothetical protein